MVTIPEALAVQQLEGVFSEFNSHGFKFSQTIINNVIQTEDSDFLHTKREQQQGYIKRIHSICSGMKTIEVPLFPYEIKGVQRIEEVGKTVYS